MSLLEIGRKCLEGLLVARQSMLSDLKKLQRVDNILDRLKIWRGATGFSATGSASIERRFRDDDESKEVLATILRRLLLGSRLLCLAEEQEPSATAGASSLTIPVSELSKLPEHSELVSGSDRQPEPESTGQYSQDEALRHIEETVSLLFRFLNLMRQNSSQPTKARVLEHRRKHGDPKDDVDFESFIRWYIEKELPGLHESKALTQRVVDTSLYRRWKMAYKKRHAQKLAQNEKKADVGTGYDQTAHSSAERSALPQINIQNAPKPAHGRKSGNKATKTLYSDTEPSLVHRLSVPQLNTRKAMSVVSRAGLTRRSQLQIPRAPQPQVVGSTEAICPFCWDVIGPEQYGDDEASRSRRSRHVVRDWTPYICLADNCECGEQQYPTTQLWTEHMQTTHTEVYCCQALGHESFMFESPDLLRRHFEQHHAEELEEGDMDDVVENAAVPSQDMTYLVIAYDPSDIAQTSPLCRLCGQDFDLGDEKGNGPKRLQPLLDHIAYDLEGLAMQCLLFGDPDEDASRKNSDATDKPEFGDRILDGLPPVRPRSIFHQEDYVQLVNTFDKLVDKDVPALATDSEALWLELVNDVMETSWPKLRYSHETDPLIQAFITSLRERDYKEHGLTFRWGSFLFNYTLRDHEGLIPVVNHSLTSQSVSHGAHYHDLVNVWLKTCLQEHIGCKNATETRPSMLLKINTLSNDGYRITLVDCSAMEQIPAYLALLTRRGTASELRPLINIYPAVMSGALIEYNQLEKSIQDTIKLVVAVGYDMLWVDALCIAYNEKKTIESWETSQIVAGAIMTVAACESSAWNHPLLNHYHQKGALKTSRIAPAKLEDENTSLWECGWALGHRVLSSRVVAFKKSRVQWQCREHFRSNDVRGDYPCTGPRRIFDLELDSVQKQYRQWLKLVEYYSSLPRNDAQDRSADVGSIAEVLNGTLKDDYLAGIWARDVANGLDWSMKQQKVYQSRSRHRSGCGPTWSWTSVHGAVTFAPTLQPRIDLRRCITNQSGFNHPFTSVHDAEIALGGCLRPLHKFPTSEQLKLFWDIGLKEPEELEVLKMASAFLLGYKGETAYSILVIPTTERTESRAPCWIRFGLMVCNRTAFPSEPMGEYYGVIAIL